MLILFCAEIRAADTFSVSIFYWTFGPIYLIEYFLQSYQEHVVSQTHVERAARVFHLEVPTKKQNKEERRDKEVYHCDICDVNCNGDINWNAHLAGSKHQKVCS